MKIQKSFYLAFVVAIVLTACGGEEMVVPVSADLEGYSVTALKGTNAAVAEKYDANGKKIESGYVINGNKNGQWTQYDADGKIRFIVNYIDGLKNGDELAFNTRGQIESRTSYRNNALDGISGK